MNKLYSFWNWYDGLASEGRGSLRFGLFMTLATICLMIMPVSLHYIMGWSVELGQAIGLLIMVPLVLTKIMRPKR
jgi:hypothetical protein